MSTSGEHLSYEQLERKLHAYEQALQNIPGVSVKVVDTLNEAHEAVDDKEAIDIRKVDLGDGFVMHLTENFSDEVLDTIPIILWTTHVDGRPKHLNAAWVAYTGVDTDEASHTRAWNIIHPDDLVRLHSAWSISLSTGQMFSSEHRMRRGSDGEYRWFLSRGYLMKSRTGKPIKWFGSMMDIHDLKLAESNLSIAELKLNSERSLLNAVVTQLPIAIYAARAPSGEIFVKNDKMSELWKSADDSDASHFDEYARWIAFHPNGRKYERSDWPISRSIATGTIIPAEDTQCIAGDGQEVTMSISAAPFYDDEDIMLGSITTAEDVTERRSFEREKIRILGEEQAAKTSLRYKSAFISTISHEIRTPLAGMLNFLNYFLF